MPELLDEASNIESTTIGVFRTSATVKGGRRFTFNALVVVGDRRGRVGYGYGKSTEVPNAVEKAQKYARRTMKPIPLAGGTLHHAVEGSFGASKVRLIPAAPGTGVVAGQTVRAVLEMLGVSDCLTKCYGSTNSINMIKAVFDAFGHMKAPETVAEIRGVKLDPTTVQEMLLAHGPIAPPPPRPRREEERPQRRGGPGRRGPRSNDKSGATGAQPTA